MDEIDVIERSRPDVEAADPRAAAAARRALMEAVADARRGAPRTAGSPRRRWAVGASVAAALVIALVLPAVLPRGSAPEASAQAALLQAAEAAASSPVGWEAPAAGEYLYTRTVGRLPRCGAGGCVLRDVEREAWVGPDGSGRVIETVDGERSEETFGPGGLPYEGLRELIARSDDEVRAFLEARAEPSDLPGDVAMFLAIGDLLQIADTPEARAALYRVAATIPSVELVGDTVDELGRPGTGVGVTWNGVRHEIVFDPGTAIVLGERDVEVGTLAAEADPAMFPGSWTAYWSGIVDSVEERP
ncbi:MAG: CU044_5270 family protein [Actinobacteria bacterium]|nr:CU044_5270 family protein [Actinomycetota bacterium]